MDKISLFHGQNSPYQNFPGIQSMIFSKKTIRTTSITKIRKIHSGVWKLQVKNSQNCQFWPKNGQILVLNGQNFAISEFSWQRCLEDIGQKHSKIAILAKNGQILTIFGHFGGQKIFSTEKIFGGHLSHMETQLHAKKYIYIERSRLQDRNGRAHVRTYIRE